MRRVFRITSIFFCFFFFCSCKIKEKMVEFQPVEYNVESETFYRQNEYSKEFEQTFIKVLDFFDEKYEYRNGVLFINKKLNDDEEWLWNLCRKAKDSSWIESRLNISE